MEGQLISDHTFFVLMFWHILYSFLCHHSNVHSHDRHIVQEISRHSPAFQRRTSSISATKKLPNISLSIVIVLSCAVCLGPIFCYLMVITFTWKSNIKSIGKETFDYIFFIVRYFGYLNSVVNPCIYFVFIKTYRQGLKRLLRCERHSRGGSNPVHENNAEEMRLTAVRPNLNNHPTT